MAHYGAAFFEAARFNEAVRDLDRVDLRRGRYAAAQLHKVTSINGRYLPLGDMVAPYLGDVESVVPYPLIQIYRHLDAFRIPTRSPNNDRVHVLAWAEEVRGMPVDYFLVNRLVFRNGRMPRNATRNGYSNVRIVVTDEALALFNTAWTFRFSAEWPMIMRRGDLMPHPALDRLVARAAGTNFAHRNHFIDRREQEIARRRRRAAQLGLRLNRRLVMVDPNDSSSDSE
jgi:hypothetical protein